MCRIPHSIIQICALILCHVQKSVDTEQIFQGLSLYLQVVHFHYMCASDAQTLLYLGSSK